MATGAAATRPSSSSGRPPVVVVGAGFAGFHCAGSLTRTFGIAGVDEHAHGFKTQAKALYLRERILGQLELAAIAPNGSTREARGSFVVVGGEVHRAGARVEWPQARTHRAAPASGMDPKVVRWTVVVGEVLPFRSGRRIEPFSWRRAGRGGAAVRHRHRYDRRTRAGDNPSRLSRAVHHAQCTFQWLERSMPGAGVPAPGLLQSLNV
jgi:hypothetical protein